MKAVAVSQTTESKMRLGALTRCLNSLPPFWVAFVLTLTETVGAGTLALPIAFAAVGPIVGVFLLVVLGSINLLTICYLAEASARNSSIRSGSAFIGKLVEDYLGTYASMVLRIALFLFCCIILASYYTGFASTLSVVTGWPEAVWVAVVCFAGLILILRKTLTGALAGALITGAINIAILLLLSAVALRHASLENFLHMKIPMVDGHSFDPSHIKLVFGIVLVSYFGHLSVSNCAQTVLRCDPSGRSLKRGAAAAMVVAIVIYSIWSVSIISAVGSENLLGETGTALVPLAKQIGPGVYVLGVVFAILGLGMSSVHFGLGIVNLSRELIGQIRLAGKPSWLRSKASTLAAIFPILIVFGYVQWTYYIGAPSFTAPLELIGALLTPVLAGIFPVLLLIASRKKTGETTDATAGAVASHPLILAAIVLLSFSGLLLHRFVLWENSFLQACADFIITTMMLLFLDQTRRGLFVSSATVIVEAKQWR